MQNYVNTIPEILFGIIFQAKKVIDDIPQTVVTKTATSINGIIVFIIFIVVSLFKAGANASKFSSKSIKFTILMKNFDAFEISLFLIKIEKKEKERKKSSLM